ncbi:DUF2934 domain-containing protein [Rhizobium wenxiniae]|uniref:DUF2934 domain-containing protein n=1 Tax=Rhizobium wenxiniae TaxID=1737357 RepID=UPI003C291AC9
MPEQREEWITKRAYELWELAGRPDGQDHKHWAKASAEWEGLEAPSTPADRSSGVWEEEEE